MTVVSTLLRSPKTCDPDDLSELLCDFLDGKIFAIYTLNSYNIDIALEGDARYGIGVLVRLSLPTHFWVRPWNLPLHE